MQDNKGKKTTKAERRGAALEARLNKRAAALEKKLKRQRAAYDLKREKLGLPPAARQTDPAAAQSEAPAFKRPVLGLCLGGGGARGIAHVGAIQAFNEAGIEFDLVAGTSIGSLMGALYCARFPTSKMMEYAAAVSMKDIRKGPIWSPDDSKKIGKVITNLLGDRKIEDLGKPFSAVAVNLITGKEVILDHGDLATAVAASCTVPLFFKPLLHNGMHLVDGGLLNNIPADVCRIMGAEKVVTVDVNPTRGGGTKDTGLFSVIKATFSIMGTNASYNGLINSDVVIAPNMSKFKSTDKEGYEEMYRLGYAAAKAKIAAVKGLVGLTPTPDELAAARGNLADKNLDGLPDLDGGDADLSFFDGADELSIEEILSEAVAEQAEKKKKSKKQTRKTP